MIPLQSFGWCTTNCGSGREGEAIPIGIDETTGDTVLDPRQNRLRDLDDRRFTEWYVRNRQAILGCTVTPRGPAMTTGRTLMTDVRLFLLGRRAAAAVLGAGDGDVTLLPGLGCRHRHLSTGAACQASRWARPTWCRRWRPSAVVAFCSPSNPDVDALAAPRLHRFDTVLVTVISACAASTAALMHLALTLTPDSLVPRIDRYCAFTRVVWRNRSAFRC